MATHAGVALELGIKRPSSSSGGVKMMSPQMEAILIWCQCRVRDYVRIIYWAVALSSERVTRNSSLGCLYLLSMCL